MNSTNGEDDEHRSTFSPDHPRMRFNGLSKSSSYTELLLYLRLITTEKKDFVQNLVTESQRRTTRGIFVEKLFSSSLVKTNGTGAPEAHIKRVGSSMFVNGCSLINVVWNSRSSKSLWSTRMAWWLFDLLLGIIKRKWAGSSYAGLMNARVLAARGEWIYCERNEMTDCTNALRSDVQRRKLRCLNLRSHWQLLMKRF